MILYIVRHGLAVDRTDPHAPAEPERPLTRKGIEKTRTAMLGLRELGVKTRRDVYVAVPARGADRGDRVRSLWLCARKTAQERIRSSPAAIPQILLENSPA